MKRLVWIWSTISMLLWTSGAAAQEPVQPSSATAPAKKDPFAGEADGKSVDPFASLMPGKAPLPSPKNVVTFNALGVIADYYTLEYQHVIQSRLALVVKPMLQMQSTKIVPGHNLDTTSLGLMAGVAFYFPQRALQGLNLSACVGVLQLKASGEVEDSKVTWSTRVMLGYRYIFQFGLSLEIAAGVLLMPDVDFFNIYSGVGTSWKGGPLVEVGLGWAF